MSWNKLFLYHQYNSTKCFHHVDKKAKTVIDSTPGWCGVKRFKGPCTTGVWQITQSKPLPAYFTVSLNIERSIPPTLHGTIMFVNRIELRDR